LQIFGIEFSLGLDCYGELDEQMRGHTGFHREIFDVFAEPKVEHRKLGAYAA